MSNFVTAHYLVILVVLVGAWVAFSEASSAARNLPTGSTR
jgi:hypothetical protein